MGHALCQRLLQEDDGLHLCLACRNPDRAEAARAALLASCPSAQITAVQVDVSDPRSVLRAAGELRRRWASAASFGRDRVTAAAGLGRDGTGRGRPPPPRSRWKAFGQKAFSSESRVIPGG